MNLSPVIFWDVAYEKIDWEKSSRFVIGRVAKYGSIDDWRKVKTFYGLERIKKDMLEERDLDLRTMSFLSCILNVPKEQFKCYATNQSLQAHISS